MISKGFKTLQTYTSVAMYPIILDISFFIFTLIVAGYRHISTASFQFSIHPGLPSISNILEDRTIIHPLRFDIGEEGMAGIIIIAFIASILLLAFVEGGFIALLNQTILDDTEVEFHTFITYGKKHWKDFIIVLFIQIILVLCMFFITIIFNFIGFFISIILAIVLRILFIFWEYTIVSENIRPTEALSKSREYFKHRVPDTSFVIVAIICFNLAFGFIVNLIPHPIFFLMFIVLYGYLATGFQFSLMHTFHATKQQYS
ncbi:hypothetical protein [Evansella halocellulosilytica]|uniref:hypothetical protein n=1 Tax=Evansella halocellulosilytica TaxID=2011013 RepID=UPI000BB9ABF4|nr:hypothetical protein [Evansella halocellulosilytica]